MASASWYWNFVRLNASGRCITEEIPQVRAFFEQQFPELLHSTLPPDRLNRSIQRQLVSLHRESQPDAELRRMAELCLRCYVSRQIRQVCVDLEARFGAKYGFTQLNLLPYVLDDVDPHSYSATHPPLSLQILQTFNPNNGSLATWTTRQVRQHKELNEILLTEYGLYLSSDWAILNKTSPDRLKRVFTETFSPSGEIQQDSLLLEAYHTVYRAARRQSGTRRICRPPTHEQLSQIAAQFNAKTGLSLSPEAVLNRLVEMADGLRHYEISVKGGALTKSIDTPEILGVVERRQMADSFGGDPTEADEQTQFLQDYEQRLIDCLDRAIEQTILARQAQLRRRKVTQRKAEIFISALELYYCSDKTMADIAQLVGLKGQYEVTRLRIKDDFPKDVCNQTLELLKDDVLELAEQYTDPDRLEQLRQQLEEMLGADLEAKIIEQSTKTRDSLFAQRLQVVSKRFRQE
jgi:hypothetical protein